MTLPTLMAVRYAPPPSSPSLTTLPLHCNPSPLGLNRPHPSYPTALTSLPPPPSLAQQLTGLTMCDVHAVVAQARFAVLQSVTCPPQRVPYT